MFLHCNLRKSLEIDALLFLVEITSNDQADYFDGRTHPYLLAVFTLANLNSQLISCTNMLLLSAHWETANTASYTPLL